MQYNKGYYRLNFLGLTGFSHALMAAPISLIKTSIIVSILTLGLNRQINVDTKPGQPEWRYLDLSIKVKTLNNSKMQGDSTFDRFKRTI